MGKISKRKQAARQAFEGKTDLSVSDAVSLIKKSASAKFSGSA